MELTPMPLLDQTFFARGAVQVARELIGCLLIRRIGHPANAPIIVRLTETEAYQGSDDPASHAYRGATPRNAPMYGAAGQLYVYLSYGIHSCVNIVTGEPGDPGAVLLRAAEPVSGLDQIRANRPGVPDRSLLNGPGKLAKGLAIPLAYNQYRLPSEGIGDIEVHGCPDASPPPILATGRIGISRGTDLPWRFIADKRTP